MSLLLLLRTACVWVETPSGDPASALQVPLAPAGPPAAAVSTSKGPAVDF